MRDTQKYKTHSQTNILTHVRTSILTHTHTLTYTQTHRNTYTQNRTTQIDPDILTHTHIQYCINMIYHDKYYKHTPDRIPQYVLWVRRVN